MKALTIWQPHATLIVHGGPYGWELEDRRALKKPIFTLGALGLWEVPDLTMKAILEDAA